MRVYKSIFSHYYINFFLLYFCDEAIKDVTPSPPPKKMQNPGFQLESRDDQEF